MSQRETIKFSHTGIGSILRQRLAVPVNQREFSWEADHVTALLEDLNKAMSAKSTYFLGTLVLTGDENMPEVADGQQRLATTTIILAAIRDYFFGHNNRSKTDTIATEYLKTTDLDTDEPVPRLKLNVDDADFFTRRIVCSPDDPKRQTAEPTILSHRRIEEAATTVAAYIAKVVATYNEDARARALVDWVTYLKNDAQIIALTVPDHMNAFVMFETLNDRGLKASQADLLKNYLLSMAGQARMREAQQRWARMVAIMDSHLIDDLTVTYLRHYVTCLQGTTRGAELYERVRTFYNNRTKALDFLDGASTGANLYSALLNPGHTLWNDYGERTRGHIRTMLDLKLEQIRPLMLAVLMRFQPAEVKKAMRLFLSWSVRFLIVGGGRGGFLDRHYGKLAKEVYDESISTTKQLVSSMDGQIPSDETFRIAFSEARVTQTFLARYYLRALERFAKQEAEPEFIPNDEEVINLEHVLPETSTSWGIDPELASALVKRLGNMVLLQAKKNTAIGNKPFEAKKPVFQASGYILTKEVGKQRAWGKTEIDKHQARLADLAVKTWPLTA